MSTKEKTTSKKAKVKESAMATKKNAKKASADTESVGFQLTPYIIIMLAFFIALCLFATSFTGWLGDKVNLLFAGLFSWGAYAVPFILVARAFCFKKDTREGHLLRNWILSFVFVIAFSAIVATVKTAVDGFNPVEHFLSAVKDGHITTGSFFGGIIANALKNTVGSIISFIILAISMFLLSAFIVSASPLKLVRFTVDKLNKGGAIAKETTKSIAEKNARRIERRIEENKTKKLEGERNSVSSEGESRKLVSAPATASVPIEEPDYNIKDDNEDDGDDEGDDIIIGPAEPQTPKLSDIFTESKDPSAASYRDDKNIEPTEAEADIKAEVKDVPVGEPDDEEEEEEQEEIYVFPTVNFLKKSPPVSPTAHSEYEETGRKLVEALASYGVQVELSEIAKGPTVTRYEVTPKVGVRVKQIKNLADDIALSLAAKGVRIEAPIPGKAAVGVEVANKTPSIVSIRSILETAEFENAASKLTTCLGVDVAGNPVYCDLAKMPHIMIAGTTGSGKSVCINAMLVSLLYKARPNEVKLILIDPKKIELNLYNGIPHLLVPVVCDAKNAAGALAWSVNEMERRFALIEETGVRDLKSYNAVALRDGNREVLPRIVIVIDELADLMMMAKDTVESSIVRIAQKARAAGMHLVIGTQRPSVDVITGLIKANVPSRIAFTVASQVDSRTIEVSGAEKLVGKGDMLFKPVGTSSPQRVQGAFVSDDEIEAVISFIKENSEANYDDEVIEGIAQEAAKCEKPKKSAPVDSGEPAGDVGDDDAMLRAAIEVAIENGSISTSMLQRKLKLGYARAARLIDVMEQMGIVSEFAGSKPRNVLITYEQYAQMMLNSDN